MATQFVIYSPIPLFLAQVKLPESVAGRQWHAISAFFLNPNYVWVVVFGGVRKWQNGRTYAMQGMVADTAVVEMGK